MARRSRNPVQLAKSASGVRLCRHRAAGGCTHFCQYKLFAKIVGGVLLVLVGASALIAYGTVDGPARVRDTAVGVGVFLAIVIPLIAVLNRQEPD